MANKQKVNLVVAVCSNRGIGVNGKLPWKLKGDMAFFKRITSETHDQGKKNAVIMGRKTWDSIPAKFRPLPNRVNIVISRTLQAEVEGVCVARSFDEAIQIAHDQKDAIENTFVIGGSSVYKMALESEHCHRVYLTRVLADFECDTHMPELDDESFKLVTDPKVDSAVQTENDISYKYEVYEKIPPGSIVMNIMVAFVDETRGFGYRGNLPWPFIRLMSMERKPLIAVKKNCYVKGRDTWLSSMAAERSNPHIINIVVSQSLRNESRDEHLHYVVDSVPSAMQLLTSMKNQVENVWVMGGTGIYTEALTLPECTKVYVTRIYNYFEADRFFPKFEHLFELTSDPDVLEGMQEENGHKFEFHVYKRKHLKV